MDILTYKFIQNALLASFLISIPCGIIGTFVVLKKLGNVAGGFSHAAFGGIGLGYFLGINPFFVALPFTLVISILFSVYKKQIKISEDIIISIIWVFGMALGIMFMNMRAGYSGDLISYLFGSILTVSNSDIIMISAIVLLTLIVFTVYLKEFTAISYSEEYAQIIGVNVTLFGIILFSFIAVTVVVLIKAVGVLIIIALLAVPPTIAKMFTYSIKRIIVVSVFLSFIFSVMGIYVSYIADMPTGPAIAIFSIVCLGIASLTLKLKNRYSYSSSDK